MGITYRKGIILHSITWDLDLACEICQFIFIFFLIFDSFRTSISPLYKQLLRWSKGYVNFFVIHVYLRKLNVPWLHLGSPANHPETYKWEACWATWEMLAERSSSKTGLLWYNSNLTHNFEGGVFLFLQYSSTLFHFCWSISLYSHPIMLC